MGWGGGGGEGGEGILSASSKGVRRISEQNYPVHAGNLDGARRKPSPYPHTTMQVNSAIFSQICLVVITGIGLLVTEVVLSQLLNQRSHAHAHHAYMHKYSRTISRIGYQTV